MKCICGGEEFQEGFAGVTVRDPNQFHVLYSNLEIGFAVEPETGFGKPQAWYPVMALRCMSCNAITLKVSGIITPDEFHEGITE